MQVSTTGERATCSADPWLEQAQQQAHRQQLQQQEPKGVATVVLKPFMIALQADMPRAVVIVGGGCPHGSLPLYRDL